jgi:ArsR family transcriptional regulator
MMEHIAKIFKALGDETRLKILLMVSRRRICAKGISKHLNISEAAVSQHLRVLKEAGITVGEKSGYFVHYNLQEPILLDVISFINNIYNDEAVHCKLSMDVPKDCKATCKGSKCCENKSQ